MLTWFTVLPSMSVIVVPAKMWDSSPAKSGVITTVSEFVGTGMVTACAASSISWHPDCVAKNVRLSTGYDYLIRKRLHMLALLLLAVRPSITIVHGSRWQCLRSRKRQPVPSVFVLLFRRSVTSARGMTVEQKGLTGDRGYTRRRLQRRELLPRRISGDLLARCLSPFRPNLCFWRIDHDRPS